MEWMIPLALGVAVVYFLFLRKPQGNAANTDNEKSKDSTISPYIAKAEKLDSYNGGEDARQLAQEQFDLMKEKFGCSNEKTDELYWNTLEQTSLPIVLVSYYAYAIGEFIENPESTPIDLNSEDARIRIAAMSAMFPEYSTFVARKNTMKNYNLILVHSANFLADDIES